jgi:hypothetical protein
MVFALEKRKKQLNILYSDHLLLDACLSPPTVRITVMPLYYLLRPSSYIMRARWPLAFGDPWASGDPWACGDCVT